MSYQFFETDILRENLLPFTYTRPVANLRVGILTIDEKWKQRLHIKEAGYLTQPYLSEKFPSLEGDLHILINGSICPTDALAQAVASLKNHHEGISWNGQLLAVCVHGALPNNIVADPSLYQCTEWNSDAILQISNTWDIFSRNGEAIEEDFEWITRGRISAPIPEGNQVLNPERIFIEEGARVLFSTLNASTGSIYIGKDAEVMEGSKIRGPFALCEGAGLKMDAKIYGPTTVGPHCKVGGEVNNSVFFGYSNKGHDGFVGNAVIGEWVNMGADTNNSNLKNTYDEVKLWNYRTKRFEKTGLTFCGLMMADHAKCGINTMFNTGTVVGVGANIFGTGFPRNFIPSFSWGGTQGFETFTLSKFFKTAEAVYKRRNIPFTDADRKVLEKVFEISSSFRFWEGGSND